MKAEFFWSVQFRIELMWGHTSRFPVQTLSRLYISVLRTLWNIWDGAFCFSQGSEYAFVINRNIQTRPCVFYVMAAFITFCRFPKRTWIAITLLLLLVYQMLFNGFYSLQIEEYLLYLEEIFERFMSKISWKLIVEM